MRHCYIHLLCTSFILLTVIFANFLSLKFSHQFPEITLVFVICRFQRDVKDLKIKADYTSCDPTGLSDWLQEIASEYRQYTYCLVKNDIDRNFLMLMTDQDLKDCGIVNSIHRKKICQKISGSVAVVYFTILQVYFFLTLIKRKAC